MSRRVFVILAGLLAMVGALVIGDRVAARFAESATSNLLVVHAPFEDKPKVQVHGVPFLTQAVRGRYDDVQITGGGLQLGDIKGAGLDAHLHGVGLSLGDVLRRQVTQLPIARVEGNVTLPYSELARISGVSGLTLSGEQGRVRVTLSVTVPVVGSVRASGTADVTVQGSGIRLKIASLSAVGVSVPQALLSQLSQAVQVPIAIPSLPYGLLITSVAAAPAGIVVHGGAQNVVLEASAR